MASTQKMAGGHNSEDDDDMEYTMEVSELYADYMPAKLKFGKKHPDAIVETASLANVEPADVHYELSIPSDTIDSGSLSALQLEAITYACQQHENILPDGSRAGFLIGDGAGVGKGRTIAGLIYENYMKGRKKAIWVSVSNDLKFDAERDLTDIGTSKIKVYSLNKFKYDKINSSTNKNVSKGIIFSTYSALIGYTNSGEYRYNTRLKQLLNWCGDDFDGVIVFDECHRAKNLYPVGASKPTKTGKTVLELQTRLPNARVVYASATGASEPKNMAYMVRLGIWGAGTTFPKFNNFINAVEKRGVGAMELVAMDMKLRGMYIARQLSFQGVSFQIEDVPLSSELTRVYDNAVKLWVDAFSMFQKAENLVHKQIGTKKTMWSQFWSSHQRFFKYLCIAAKVKRTVQIARRAVRKGKCVIIGLQSTGEARTMEQLGKDNGELSDFVSTAKGVFLALVEKNFPKPHSSEIEKHLKIQKGGGSQGPSSSGGHKERKKSNIGISGHKSSSSYAKRIKYSNDSDSTSDNSDLNTSESEISDDSDTSSDSEASSVIGRPLRKNGSRVESRGKKRKNKAHDKKQTAKDKKYKMLLKSKMINNRDEDDPIRRVCRMKNELIERIEKLGKKLPPNTLDQLIYELGGPEKVAEMTGRKGRVVETKRGVRYESRSEVDVPLETLNVIEKQRFMDGEKYIAIISEAASSGISLQSDRRAQNQRRRVHITLELPWSADKVIQQFGRSHRSNQVSAPEYKFLISNLAGERRFASIVAKRLESLGALTHGDRRATETRDLSRFNIDNVYGRRALGITMRTIIGTENPIISPPDDYRGDFFNDVTRALAGVGLVNIQRRIAYLENDYNNVTKFLNRILGLPVDLQNRLFKYYTDVLQHIVTKVKKSGRYDLEILDLGIAGENVKHEKLYTFLRQHATGQANTELHILHGERGMNWNKVVKLSARAKASNEGFYISHTAENKKRTVALALLANNFHNKNGSTTKFSKNAFTMFRPNTGLQLTHESLSDIHKIYYKTKNKSKVEKYWKEQYDSSGTVCTHFYWRGSCKLIEEGKDCDVGLRSRTYNILSGSVLNVWSRIENVLADYTKSQYNMQVVRLKTVDGTKIIGILIPDSCVKTLIENLSLDAENMDERVYDE